MKALLTFGPAAVAVAYSVGVVRGMNRQRRLHDRWDAVREARWLELGRAEGMAAKDNPQSVEAYLTGIGEGVRMERDRVAREESRRHHPSTPDET